MIFRKQIFIALFAFASIQTQSWASSEEVDLLSSVSISKDDILKSMETLKNQGQISQADFDKAKKELANMNDSQLNSIKNVAVEMVKKDPDKALSLVQAKKIDTEAVGKELKATKP